MGCHQVAFATEHAFLKRAHQIVRFEAIAFQIGASEQPPTSGAKTLALMQLPSMGVECSQGPADFIRPPHGVIV